MRYFVKSKRKHGNPEDFRWFNGYPDQPVMGVLIIINLKKMRSMILQRLFILSMMYGCL
jgi:hypothetical protein